MVDKRKMYILNLITFMDLFAVGLTVPLFSNHVRELGGTHFAAGLLSAAYSGTQLISGPVIGSWSDIRGRKRVLIVTLLISGLSYYIIGLTTSLYLLFVTRVILGFAKHTQTLCKALIADTIPKSAQSTVFGCNASISMIGFIVGPILGGHLSEYTNGYYYVCSITSALFCTNIFLTSLLSRSKTSKVNTTITLKNEMIKAITDLTKIEWRSYWALFVTKYLHALAITIYFFNYSMMLRENYDVSQKVIGYTIAFQSCIGAIAGMLTGKINKTFFKNDSVHTKKYFVGFAIMTSSFILLSKTSNLNSFLIALIPLAVSNSFLRIVETEILLVNSKNDKGSLVGTSNSVSSMARLGAPIISGLMSDIFGQESTMFLSILLSSCAIVIVGFMSTKVKIKSI